MGKKESVANIHITDHRTYRVDTTEIFLGIKVATHACVAIQKPGICLAKKLQMATAGAAFTAREC